MSFETEKFITLLYKFLDEHGDEYENDEEAIADFQMKYNLNITMGGGFIDDSDEDILWDLLEELHYARPGTPKRKKVAKQILEIEPDNLEAKQALFSYLHRLEELYELEKLEREEYKKLDPEEMGWEYIENRPYLRLKADLAGKYVRNAFFTKAEKQYKELLEMNPNDSLGARFELMNVYAHLEKYDEAKAFLDEYEKEYRLNDLLLVPMMLVALKVGKNEVAEDYYRKLLKGNSDVTKFLRLLKKEGVEGVEMIADEPNDGYYRPDSMDSLVLCFGRLAKTIDLNYFAEWLIVTKKTLTKKK